MAFNITYKEYYGEWTDGGAKWICVKCCNGFECVSDPNERIRSAKGFLCADCRKRYAQNKKEFRAFSKEMHENAAIAQINFYIRRNPEVLEGLLKKLQSKKAS